MQTIYVYARLIHQSAQMVNTLQEAGLKTHTMPTTEEMPFIVVYDGDDIAYMATGVYVDVAALKRFLGE